jgi:hypothetical protein
VIDTLSSEERIAFGEILGTIPSDGYLGLRSDGLLNYILASKDREFVELIADRFSTFGISVRVHRRKSGLWYIEVCRKWFDDFFLPYLESREGGWVFSPLVVNCRYQKFKAAILRSFADADGTVTCCIRDGNYYSRHISFYNKSTELLSQIKSMLASFGITGSIYLARGARPTLMKGQVVEFPSVYQLSITNRKNLLLFYESIGFGISRKMDKLEEILRSYKKINRVYSAQEYQRVMDLYEDLGNCREVSRRTGIPAQTVQNWVLLGIKPRILKSAERMGEELP